MNKSFWIVLLFCLIKTNMFSQGNSFLPNEKYDSLRIMLVGDLMQSNAQIAAAYDAENKYYDYSNCFRYIQPLFSVSDIVIANLETTFSGKPYSSNPYFSAPEQFALAIKFSGINCLMTANDHCADRDKEGIVTTINLLDSFGIKHTGTFLNKADKYLRNPLIVDRNGFKIAILNYTFGTKYAVKDSNMVNIIQVEKIKRDLYETSKQKPNFTIVYFHWGTEYERFPSDEQRDLAKVCFDNGADFVAGSNPHVLQRAEEIKFYSYGQLKTGFVAYSLGNFLSDYDRRFGDGAAILEVVLSKEKATNITKVSDYGFVPTFVVKDDGKGGKPMQVVPISEVQNKHITVDVSAEEMQKMATSALDTKTMLNTAVCSESKYKLNDDIIGDVAETIMLTGAPVNKDKNEPLLVVQKPLVKTIFKDTSTIAQINPRSVVTPVEIAPKNVANIQNKNTTQPNISTPVNVTLVDPKITPDERVKDSIVVLSTKKINALTNKNQLPVLAKNKFVVARLDSFVFQDKRDRDSLIAYNKAAAKVIANNSTTTNPVTNISTQKPVSIDTSSKTIANTSVVAAPVKKTIEEEIAEFEEKFKKYGNISYKVKFYDMPSKVEINTYYYKYLEGYESVQENGNWVYYLGNTPSFDEAKNRCLLLRSKGLKKIMIIPFVNGKKIDWVINF